MNYGGSLDVYIKGGDDDSDVGRDDDNGVLQLNVLKH